MDGKQTDVAVNRAVIVFFFNCKLKSAKYLLKINRIPQPRRVRPLAQCKIVNAISVTKGLFPFTFIARSSASARQSLARKVPAQVLAGFEPGLYNMNYR
jgi:hypothetical protein